MTCHVDWGPEGVVEARKRGDAIVVVDVLRFTSSATAAVSVGMRLLPVEHPEEAEVRARELGLRFVPGSGDNGPDQPTMSPLWYVQHGRAGMAVVYASPNGARLTSLVSGYPHAFLGSLLNARHVARLTAGRALEHGINLTVVAAGERSTDFDRQAAPRRLFAVEDYLAAGAIAQASGLPLSAEARVAASAWQSCRQDIAALLRACISGQSLVQAGLAAEVNFCAQVDTLPAAPIVEGGWVVAAHDS